MKASCKLLKNNKVPIKFLDFVQKHTQAMTLLHIGTKSV